MLACIWLFYITFLFNFTTSGIILDSQNQLFKVLCANWKFHFNPNFRFVFPVKTETNGSTFLTFQMIFTGNPYFSLSFSLFFSLFFFFTSP